MFLQDKWEMQQELYTYCTSSFPWGGFSDPGHFLLWGRVGRGGHKIPHEARTPHNTREKDQTPQRLHATSTYPLDVLHFPSSLAP